MSWPLVSIASCARIVGGATPSTVVAEYWDGDICWATPKDLSELSGHYIENTPRKLTASGLASCAAEVLPAGSVLFSSRAPIGHVAVCRVPMATNQGFKSFIPNTDRLDAKYLYHWLRANRTYLESLGNGATFKEVSKAVVARVEIPLPPLGEQRRIARILDMADALRQKRSQALRLVAQLCQSIFNEMFGDPIANQKGWVFGRLDDCIDPERPLTYGILMPGPNLPSGVKYIRVVDMKDGEIVLSSVRTTAPEIAAQYQRSTLVEGDLLMSIRGHVGRTAVVPGDLVGANITQDTARIAVANATTEFIREMIEHPSIQRWMAQRTKGAAVKGINLGDLRAMPIIRPPLTIQAEYSNRCRTVRRQAVFCRRYLDLANSIFASLQNHAFNGEL